MCYCFYYPWANARYDRYVIDFSNPFGLGTVSWTGEFLNAVYKLEGIVGESWVKLLKMWQKLKEVSNYSSDFIEMGGSE